MKKLLSLMLALSMLLGCLSFAAAEGNDVIEINIYHHMSTDTARGQALRLRVRQLIGSVS